MATKLFTTDEDGYFTFRIPVEGDYVGKTLWDMETYINSLDEETCAESNINKYGPLITLHKCPTVLVKKAPDSNIFGIVVGDEFSPLVFRGENKYYKDFRPSAFRYSDNPEGKERVSHCVDTIKKKEFLQLFKKSPYYTRCTKFEVLGCKFEFDLEAVAQHYGFMSNYIDISKSFLVALFFAYTYQEDGVYMPITDFEEYSPTLYVGNLKEIYNDAPGQLRLIGFQSILRPLLQRAMAIEVSRDNNVKSLFKKIELPKEKVFASEIYASFAYGYELFTRDFFGTLSFNMKKSKSLSHKFYDEYCRENNLSAEDFIEELKQEGYSLTEEERNIPEFCKYMMHKEIDDGILPLLRKIEARICPDWLVDDK